MKKQHALWFLCIFGLLAILPLFQQAFHPFKLAGLQGAFDKGTPPKLNSASWFKGNFQIQADYYLKNNIGFNGELVRLRNQVDYSAFGNINTNLTLGKENYIFDPNYIFAREGTDYLIDSVRIEKAHAIKRVKNVLDSINVPLLFCFAPNKSNYYPEYLPSVSSASEKTNQIYFKNLLSENNIPIIDFDSWFIKLKNNSKYPLIPKYGAHWSTYGASIAADSLIKKLSAITNKNIETFSIVKLEPSAKAKFSDDDYLASLNLMKKWESPEMVYPVLKFVNGVKPNVLIISDSFIWNFYDLAIMQNCFSPASSVWYYNKSEFDSGKNNIGPLTGKFRIANLKQRDAIIIIATGPSLKDFGYGFFEQLNNAVVHE
jgi:hypothetical protein